MSHCPPIAQMLHASTDWSLKRPVQRAFHSARLRVLPPTSSRASSIQHPASPRSGLTLIEMLVALAVTLVMMAAVVNLFANISGSIRNRRAVIEVSGQLRQVRAQLARDLAGATCKGHTWQRPGEDAGYIEIIEGQWNDTYPSELVDGVSNTATPPNLELDYTTSQVPSGGVPTIDLTATNPPLTARGPQSGDITNGRALGDWDDIIALTVHSETEPYRARVFNVATGQQDLVSSNYAEVVWYSDENPQDDPSTTPDETLATGTRLEPGMRRIYRRVFLIVPTLGPWPIGNRPDNISVRFVPNGTGGGQWVANDLSDLTKRENRMCREHDTTLPEFLFPHPFLRGRLDFDTEYRILDDALAFDVRVYDPGAPLYNAGGGSVVQPGDPGWPAAFAAAGAGINPVGFGAYCDLGWNWDQAAGAPYPTGGSFPPGSPEPLFEIPHRVGWHPYFLTLAAPQPLTGSPAVYDTWSFHYENDGLNQEEVLVQVATNLGISPLPQFADWQINTLDQGTNGLDDEVIPGTPPTVGINGVDDPGERETAPPYDFPLRGVKVSLRIYERDARQIRETSVTHSFAP